MNRYIVVKYLQRLNLKSFKQTPNSFYFKCPLSNCGDMQSKKHNGRAYVLNIDSDQPNFYCHNCGTKANFTYFIKMVDESLYYELKAELNDYEFIQVVKNDENKINNNDIKEKKKRIIKKIKTLKDYLHTVNEYDDNSLPVKYLNERKIPTKHWNKIYYFMGNPYEFFTKIFKNNKYSERKKIIIEGLLYPFYDRDGILYGYAIRNLDKDSIQRFFNLTLDGVDMNFLGIDKVKFDRKIYILEGIYDKLSFVRDRQILAMMSLNVKLNNLSKNIDVKNIVYVFDNEYDNDFLYKNAIKVIKSGCGIMLWDVKMVYKDVNDLKKIGWSDDDFYDYFDRNTYFGFDAIMELDKRVKIFKNRSYYV
jgi:hypothetical protein